MQKNMTKRLCVIAVLIAMQIVLGRVAAINVGNYLKISFGFIPIAVCGILTGPFWTLLMASVCDILGALLFPTENLLRCMLCTLTVALICNILLNTVFLIQIGAMVGPGNEGFWTVMWTRVLKNLIQFPVNGLILFGVWKALQRIPASLRAI